MATTNQVSRVFVCQLNNSTVGDIHIKVSIAKKQPMLDAATGKSVWASLGKPLSTTICDGLPFAPIFHYPPRLLIVCLSLVLAN